MPQTKEHFLINAKDADQLWTKHRRDLDELEQLDAAQRSRTDRGLLEKIQARRLRLQQTEGTSNGTTASTSVSVAVEKTDGVHLS